MILFLGFGFLMVGGFVVRRSDWESMFQRGIRRGCGFIVTADERIREGKAVNSTDLSGSVFLPPSSSWYCRTLKKSRKIKSFFTQVLRFSLFLSHLCFFLQYRIGWIQVEGVGATIISLKIENLLFVCVRVVADFCA